ncbi:MAG: hypothetical protein MUF30_06280 [Burkholderiales bacterium]|jgi:hypothetical protein|nr:hypothetical protein [Burkholderiales bacterium]
MTRRRFLLRSAGLATAWVGLSGHSPYRQWIVYRDTHLVVITSRDDPAGDALGDAIVAAVRARLPDSHAAVGRGPRVQRIASLLSTRQADIAVVERATAVAMARGTGPFDAYGPIALRTVVESDTHLLVCRADFLAAHAWLLAEALAGPDTALGLRVAAVADADAIAAHPGAVAWHEGRPLEAPTASK